jgi:o-succinylbenzoate synthase
LRVQIIRYQINFIKPARTSRNTFNGRKLYYVVVSEGGIQGIGESAPLEGLSVDDSKNFEFKLSEILTQLIDEKEPFNPRRYNHLPSAAFGIETALMDLKHGGSRVITNNSFIEGKRIPINGLVWMDEIPVMLKEASQKIEAGFKCIKFKVGAHDFDAECRMLEQIRNKWSAFKLELRIDANGAFAYDDAQMKLQDLSRFELHSIEQPIKPRQPEAMEKLCREGAIPIALDEELIGINPWEMGEQVIQLNPAYVVIKPNLVGGLSASDEWVRLARKANIGWWSTSALESNIGLNAIAQWVSKYELIMPQGLGTGSLYSNNIDSPLMVQHDSLVYSDTMWNTNTIFDQGEEIFSYG